MPAYYHVCHCDDTLLAVLHSERAHGGLARSCRFITIPATVTLHPHSDTTHIGVHDNAESIPS